MIYTGIGNGSDKLKVSKLVLGTDYFGTRVSEETSFRLLDLFEDAGGNCIDTARIYTSWVPGGDGVSERTIGKWLKSRGCRNRVLLSTKGGHPPLERMNSGRLSRQEIESDLEESLRVLGTDMVDMYWLHRDDPSYPVEDIMDTISRLIEKGKVRAAGISNWRTDRIEAANRTAGKAKVSASGNSPAANTAAAAFCASQIQWSLATSTPEIHGDPTIVCMDEKEYQWYERNAFPVFAYSAQAKGFFTRAASGGLGSVNEKAMTRFASPENMARLERVKEYARQTGLTVTAVSLGYILCNRVPAVAILGCKTEEQLMDSLTASDVHFPEHVVNWLFNGG